MRRALVKAVLVWGIAAFLVLGLRVAGAGAQTVTPALSNWDSMTQAQKDAWVDLDTELRKGGPGHYDDGGSKLSKVLQNAEKANTPGADTAKAGRFRAALNGARTKTKVLPKLAAKRAVPVAGAFFTGYAIGGFARTVYIDLTTPMPVANSAVPRELVRCDVTGETFGPCDPANPERDDAMVVGFDYQRDNGTSAFSYFAYNGESPACRTPWWSDFGRFAVADLDVSSCRGQPGAGKVRMLWVTPQRMDQKTYREGDPEIPTRDRDQLTAPAPDSRPDVEEGLKEFWDSPAGEPLRELWPWLREQAELSDEQIADLDLTESPIGTDPKVTIPQPRTGETAAAYNQRLQELGLNSAIRQRASGDNDPTVGPDGITKITPSAGEKVTTGTAVEVETNPSDAPAPGTGGGGTPGGGSAPQCGLSPPAARVDLSPLSRLDARGRFPLSLLTWVTGTVGGLAGERVPPEFQVSVWGQSAGSQQWWGLVDPIFVLLRGLFVVVLWVGVVWWLYERTLGRQTA